MHTQVEPVKTPLRILLDTISMSDDLEHTFISRRGKGFLDVESIDSNDTMFGEEAMIRKYASG